VDVASEGEPPAPLDWPFDGAAPTADPGWSDIVYALHGDPHTGEWTINGELFPDITIETLPLDVWALIELRNISQTAHPFHLHGQTFEVLNIDGDTPAYRSLEDTINVAPYTIVRLGLLPDNPGDWMAHCHILPHAHGMMTVLHVGP
jgi:FtsP/CotA-like multicopper oxidase with cupredoxin domain